jgi:ABC-type bacteriocin/lantibiotic exporter with double-glycine peptidase domain
VNNINKPDQVGEVYKLLKYFVMFSMLYLVLYYLFKVFQNRLLTKLRQWIRLELITIVLNHNNENFTDKNFIELSSPINRLANMCFMFISDLLSFILPNFVFLLVIFCYFIYKDYYSGLLFLLFNLLILVYIYLVFPSMVEKNEKYESSVLENENYLLELLNNVDKVVYRGQTSNEIGIFNDITAGTIDKSYVFYSFMNEQVSLLNLSMYLILFSFLYYNTRKLIKKETTVIYFITFVTIIILYRDRMGFMFQQVTEFMEFTGRANGVLGYFSDITILSKPPYKNQELAFDKVRFENVTFKYDTKDETTIKKLNLQFNLQNKIIGITGQSGSGKSTIIKLLLKMYSKYHGNIYIDDVNIRDIDPEYIRKKIIYVNQNFKLFDRLIIENIMYGCSHDETCKQNLSNIMKKYKKINELFKDNDIYTTRVGPLGEKLSGGQKVVVSIIAGLISPSVGLILDEPTVGLDGELKTDVLNLIRDYKKQKKFILIVTHDSDAYKILDERKDIK